MSDLPVLSRTIPPWLAVSSFEQAERLALLLSKDDTLPKHCVGKPGVCFRLVVQAMTWGVNPYTVAEASVPSGGKITYTGKFLHALLLHLGVLATHFTYSWGGPSGPGRNITLTGVLKASGEVKTIQGTVGQWRGSSQQWDRIPDDMLLWHACRAWQGRYAPEILVGAGLRHEDEPIAAEATVTLGGVPVDQLSGEAVESAQLEALESLCERVEAAMGDPQGKNFLAAILKGYGVERVWDVPAEKRGEFARRLTHILDASNS